MPSNHEREQELLISLDQYDGCRLECDGLTRVLSYILSKEAVDHTVMLGEIMDRETQRGFRPHFWITLPDGRIIDYRTKTWLGDGEHIPHGIFNPHDYSISYEGEEIVFENLENIALMLLAYECDEMS